MCSVVVEEGVRGGVGLGRVGEAVGLRFREVRLLALLGLRGVGVDRGPAVSEAGEAGVGRRCERGVVLVAGAAKVEGLEELAIVLDLGDVVLADSEVDRRGLVQLLCVELVRAREVDRVLLDGDAVGGHLIDAENAEADLLEGADNRHLGLGRVDGLDGLHRELHRRLVVANIDPGPGRLVRRGVVRVRLEHVQYYTA